MKATRLKAMVVTVTVVAATSTAFGFNADVFTTAGQNRLFLDAAEITLAPTGTVVWIVADTDVNGLNGVSSGQITLSAVQAIQTGTGPDKLVWADTVDGQLLGAQAGRFRRNGIPVSDSYSGTAGIIFILWGGFTAGNIGDTFGWKSFGTWLDPGPLQNQQVEINSNIHAAGAPESVVVIPEPYTLTLVGLGLLGLVGLRRLSKG